MSQETDFNMEDGVSIGSDIDPCLSESQLHVGSNLVLTEANLGNQGRQRCDLNFNGSDSEKTNVRECGRRDNESDQGKQ
jgi:hypothetical protein